MESQTQPEPKDMPEGRFIMRCTAAVVVVLTTSTYIIALVLGQIPIQQKLGGAEISLAAGHSPHTVKMNQTGVREDS
jgi:hypothetical protein